MLEQAVYLITNAFRRIRQLNRGQFREIDHIGSRDMCIYILSASPAGRGSHLCTPRNWQSLHSATDHPTISASLKLKYKAETAQKIFKFSSGEYCAALKMTHLKLRFSAS
jgi:hypothetical protein